MSVVLFHRDLGGDGHRPLVLLHGMLGSSRNWQTVGRDLADAAHVYAVDARNHGQSPHAEPIDYPAMMADLLAWLEANTSGPVDLLGHSMGGKTAMMLACRHPDRVRRLIVVDMAPRDYNWPGGRAEYTAMNALDLAALKSRADAETQMEGVVKDWAMRKFLTTNLERDDGGNWRWIINLPVLSQSLPILERNPLAADDHFDGPTVFITGAKSSYVRPEDHAAIARHFPSARVKTLVESGHNPHMETREAFVAEVRAALTAD
ncbi:MAG: alpha/beta fold hydrolase [Cephaloticoccus sp.]|nr:alpha/beta fold hydrolase [Cephaloticoccus sp.]